MNSARLWHWDLHLGNLFVLDGQITSRIDWQSSTVEPFFLQGRHPRLVRYSGEPLLHLPDNFKQLDAEQQDAVEEQVSSLSFSTPTKAKPSSKTLS
jgi:Phosphotransferase enzyme family